MISVDISLSLTLCVQQLIHANTCIYIYIYKSADRSRDRPEGSPFNS